MSQARDAVPSGEGSPQGDGLTRGETVGPTARLYADCCGKLARADELTTDAEGWLMCAECLAEARAERLQDHDPQRCNHPNCRLSF